MTNILPFLGANHYKSTYHYTNIANAYVRENSLLFESIKKTDKWAAMGLKMDAGSGSINRDGPHKDSHLNRPLKRSASINEFYETDSFDNLRESILRDG